MQEDAPKRRSTRLSASLNQEEAGPSKKSKTGIAGPFALDTNPLSYDDRKLLLLGLKRYGVNLDIIQKRLLPSIPKEKLEKFITSNNLKQNRILLPDEYAGSTPIERWLQLADELTVTKEDSSECLGDVFSVLGDLEPHDTHNCVSEANWPSIYNYFAVLLQGGTPPNLRAVDAAVVLRLLQDLADYIRTLDIQKQRKLMLRKHALLVNGAKLNRQHRKELLEMALQGDPLDLDDATFRAWTEEASDVKPSVKADDTPATSSSNKTPTSSSSRQGDKSKTQTRKENAILYSINPFCIPIKYLNPQPKSSSSSS